MELTTNADRLSYFYSINLVAVNVLDVSAVCT